MAQQTTLAAVRDYYLRFVSLWPTVNDLAAAPLDDVLKQWAGLGYYARARNLHGAAEMVAKELGGEFPTYSGDLQKLPGVGPYTAAAIAAICHDERIAVVDGNVDRVMARVLALPVPVREAKPRINAEVQNIVPARAGDFAQAMMDLGATLCAPKKAACVLCPISLDCAARAEGMPEAYPIKPTKAARPQKYGHAFAIQRADGAVWLQKRGDKGMLAKMTEVPGSDWSEVRSAPAYPISGDWRSAGTVSHIFTHFALELDVWVISAEPEWSNKGWWSMQSELNGEALPSLFKKVLNAAMERKSRR